MCVACLLFSLRGLETHCHFLHVLVLISESLNIVHT